MSGATSTRSWPRASRSSISRRGRPAGAHRVSHPRRRAGDSPGRPARPRLAGLPGRSPQDRAAEPARQLVLRGLRHEARARDARRHHPPALRSTRSCSRTSRACRPEHFHVVTPDPDQPVHTFRVADFAAYFRLYAQLARGGRRAAHERSADANYPEPVEHCDVCRWWERCDERRRAGRSPLVRRRHHARCSGGAGGAGHRRRSRAAAAMPLPLAFKPARGALESYERRRAGAAAGRSSGAAGAPVHELLAARAGAGTVPAARAVAAATCSSISKAIRSRATAAASTSSVW